MTAQYGELTKLFQQSDLIAEFDVTVNQMGAPCFHSTIRIWDYGDDIAIYLGNAEITNEISAIDIDRMIDDNDDK